jgi:2-(1,2-epoxy-1,2-dihydrophenyl)acetyl-CoA isomerase
MTHRTIVVERTGAVARITFNRPDSFNAYDMAVGEELQDAMEACGRDDGVRAVILTGTGKAFCSGGDVRAMKDFAERGDEPPSAFFQKLTRFLHGTIAEMRRMPKPVVGAINGVAAGAGFSFALACDLCMAGESARFTQAYTRLGLVPDGGSSFFLPRLLGAVRTAELMMLNPVLDARQALQWGILSRVVPDGELARESLELARRLAQGAPRAYAGVKALLSQSWDRSLEAQLEEERRAIMAASLTQDFREGLVAFVSKREPRFSGR